MTLNDLVCAATALELEKIMEMCRPGNGECPRCKKHARLNYRVQSDILDERHCLKCALEARKLGLWVEEIEES